MRSGLRILLLYSTGPPYVRVMLARSLVNGLLGVSVREFVPNSNVFFRFVNKFTRNLYESLGYVNDWREAFSQANEYFVDECDVLNVFDLKKHLRRIESYDLIIILHSAFGDTVDYINSVIRLLDKRRGRLVFFVGNEYDLLPKKKSILRQTGAEFICSQLPIEASHWLYGDVSSAKVISVPHALNPKIYRPGELSSRPVDVGFVGATYFPWLGDIERNRFILHMQENGVRYAPNIRIITNKNMSRVEWSSFLRMCNGVIGAESGTYYLDKSGKLLEHAKNYYNTNKCATEEDILSFVNNLSRSFEFLSGKCISSRHFEAVGTMTCQLLLEGNYNGILEPGRHYISICKDLSNLNEAFREFKDATRRREIVAAAYEHVIAGHTFQVRVSQLVKEVTNS